MKIFTERLKKLRKLRGLTQGKMAAILNYGSSAVSNYENGKNQPSYEDLVRIADYFKVSTDYLLGRVDIETGLYLVKNPISKTIMLRVEVQEKTIHISIEEPEK